MIRLVIFDWAGTLVDHGSRAPALAFVETFAKFGVTASEAEARAPMGMPKRPHLAEMLAAPPLAVGNWLPEDLIAEIREIVNTKVNVDWAVENAW